MEVRAKYLLMGLFTLGVLLAGALFSLWIADKDNIPMVDYEIWMRESVAGLTLNSDVLFNGVRVGAVSRIKISENDPRVVIIRVLIAADTPVREDSTANLIPRGVTGFSLVSISGGSPHSPRLQVPYGQMGVIRATPSPMDSVMQNFPDALSAAHELLRRLNTMFAPKNIEAFSAILESLDTLSSSLAKSATNLDAVLHSAGKAGDRFSSLADDARRLLDGMEPGLRRFSRDGLTDVRMLLLEARTLVQTLGRIGRQLENNPRRFFFGDMVKEYQNP